MPVTNYFIYFPAYTEDGNGVLIPCYYTDPTLAYEPPDQSDALLQALFGSSITMTSSWSEDSCYPYTGSYTYSDTSTTTVTRKFSRFAVLNNKYTRTDVLFDVTPYISGAYSDSGTGDGCCLEKPSTYSQYSSGEYWADYNSLTDVTFVSLDPEGFTKNTKKDIFIVATRLVVTESDGTGYEEDWIYNEPTTGADDRPVESTTYWPMSTYFENDGYWWDDKVYVRFFMGGKLYEALMPYSRRDIIIPRVPCYPPGCNNNEIVTCITSYTRNIEILQPPLLNPTCCTNGPNMYAIHGWYPSNATEVTTW